MSEKKKLNIPPIGRIKISAGYSPPNRDHCYPTSDIGYTTSITDADTGQCLNFVSGIEIINNVGNEQIIKLVVRDPFFDIDMHVKRDLSDVTKQGGNVEEVANASD